MLKVYRNNKKIGYLPNDDVDTLARYISGISPEETEQITVTNDLDFVVVETLGNLISDVPDQEWHRKEFYPLLLNFS